MSQFAHHQRTLSDAEWIALDEEISGEFVDGELVEEEMPDFAHEVVIVWLIALLSSWIDQHGGIIGGSGAKFLLKKGRGRKPDISIFLRDRRPPRTGAIRMPPDVMVEVISSSPSDIRRDRIEKMDEYAAFGVRWYWLVDPSARTFEIYECHPGGVYARVVGASAGVVKQVPGMEGLVVDLDALWRKLDELPEATDEESE
jgi:Uma2 family endonuclease